MQLLTTTFLFTIILAELEGSISENTQETMIALAISLTECQEALSERQFGKQRRLLCLELTFAHEALVLIPKNLGDLTDFFRDISFKNDI